MTDLHLPPAEIERKILANIAMYEDAKWPSATTKMLAQHWTDCLKALHAYQEGRITRKDVPLDVLQMGWTMPEWGTRGS
jgi:hypothetical protein